MLTVSGTFSGVVSRVLSNTTNTPNIQFLNVYGIKGFNVTGVAINNSSSIYLGFKSGQLPITINAGGTTTITLPSTRAENLNNIWGFGENGDGFYIVAS